MNARDAVLLGDKDDGLLLHQAHARGVVQDDCPRHAGVFLLRKMLINKHQ
jgi:hypothetical protein